MLDSRFTFAVSTMGCKANLTDSQTLEARLRKMGGTVASDDEAEVFILNTCTVTDQADREAKKILKKKNSKLLVVTGCMAEVSADKLATGKIVVARNSGRDEIPSLVESWLKNSMEQVTSGASAIIHGDRIGWHEKMDYEPGAAAGAASEKSEHRTRAFLKVQDGCNSFCSYCIIPHARGRSRSLSAEKIIEEVNLLVAQGVREVVLTAIHAADYHDEGKNFTALVRAVLENTSLPRVRLTSLDPAEISDDLLDLMATEPRLCAHFHVSMQSASTRVLGAMKRGYDATKAEECLQKIHAKIPHAFIGMDMIVGFPGETDEEFQESYDLLMRNSWNKLHVFPYSVRQGTVAARMVMNGDGVTDFTKSERARKLRNLSDQRMQQSLEQKIGSLMEVLTEEKKITIAGAVYTQGHSRNYFRVLVKGNLPANELVRAQIIAVGKSESLLGEVR